MGIEAQAKEVKTLARQTTVFQVFIASPSDVEEERKILDVVISELNQIWSRSLGLTFELLKWETNVRPGFSSDPQAVINDQIDFDYDVFIGVFWGRIGTATPRAESGTLEEFERAYSRFKKNGAIPELMLYFKDAPIAPSKLDPDQLRCVQEFKRSLSARGGLYSEFEDSAGFESSVRAHLSAIAKKFSQPSFISTILPLEPKHLPEPADEDELGFFDHIEVYQSKLAEMTIAIGIINDATTKVGEQIAQSSQEIGIVNLPTPDEARKFVSKTADDMNDYALIVQTQVATLSSSQIVAFNSLSNALSLHSDFSGNNDEDLVTLKDTLISMREGAGYAKSSMTGMREAAEGLPRMSKELNKAKRAVVLQLNGLLFELDSIQSTVNNIIEAIDRMIDK